MILPAPGNQRFHALHAGHCEATEPYNLNIQKIPGKINYSYKCTDSCSLITEKAPGIVKMPGAF